jgi:hypothetical protein
MYFAIAWSEGLKPPEHLVKYKTQNQQHKKGNYNSCETEYMKDDSYIKQNGQKQGKN